MSDNKICPKCQGMMKVGDYTGTEVNWQKNGEQTFLKQSGHKIVTYACEKCGFMESYVR